MYAGADGAKRLLEATQNIPDGGELGVLLQPSQTGNPWFVIFSFRPVGYVKDDEEDSLDAEKILASIRKGNDKANEVRHQRGWAPLQIVGWEQEPFYDAETHNLSWAIRGRTLEAGKASDVINYRTRLLGHGGVMNADLVISPEQVTAALPSFKTELGGFSFTPGQRYSEFRKGDKVAEYGLAALVVGGAAAVAAPPLGRILLLDEAEAGSPDSGDPDGTRERVELWRYETRTLRLMGNLLWEYLFLACPVIAREHGLIASWPFLLAGLLLLETAVVLELSFVHRALLAGSPWRRLGRTGLSLDLLRAPPEAREAGALSYCPRCHGQFSVESAVCGDCDLPSRPFPARAPARRGRRRKAVRP